MLNLIFFRSTHALRKLKKKLKKTKKRTAKVDDASSSDGGTMSWDELTDSGDEGLLDHFGNLREHPEDDHWSSDGGGSVEGDYHEDN